MSTKAKKADDKPSETNGVAVIETPQPTSLAVRAQIPAEALEKALTKGDLSFLSADERTRYYVAVCESLGLNHLTQPLAYITLNGKMVLYARRECTEQLRKIHNVTVEVVSREIVEDCLTVHVRASMPTPHGMRKDEDFGVVSLAGLKGEARANALMKALTKGKRRVTLSICGMGFLDETEVETIPHSQPSAPAPRRQEPEVIEVVATPAPAKSKVPEHMVITEADLVPVEEVRPDLPPINPSATAAQTEFLRKMLAELSISEEQALTRCKVRFEKPDLTSLEQLTSSQAGQLIELMMSKKRSANGA